MAASPYCYSNEVQIMALIRYSVWADVQGRTRLSLINSSTTSSTVLSLLSSYSNAGIFATLEGSNDVLAETGVNAEYSSVSDYVALQFETGAGEIVSLTLPAPDASIFFADGVTVDSSAIPDLIAACVGNLLSPGGGVVTEFVGGIRSAGKPTEYVTGSGGGGLVSSVGLVLPAPFVVTGSPVTGSGDLTGAWPGTVADGQVLIGKSSDHSMHLATLTGGTDITIVDGPGTITINASGSIALTTVTAALAADYVLTLATTPYDVLSVVLTTGFWLVYAQLSFDNASFGVYASAQLTDNSITIAEGETNTQAANTPVAMSLSGLYDCSGGSATIFLVAENNGALTHVKADPVHFGSGQHQTTQIYAVKIG